MDNPDPEMESPEFDPASLRVCRICAESTTEDVLDSNDGCCMNLECSRRNASNKEKQMRLLEKRNNDVKAGAMKEFVVSHQRVADPSTVKSWSRSATIEHVQGPYKKQETEQKITVPLHRQLAPRQQGANR